MDKQTITNYLKEIHDLMVDGKFISAHNRLRFVLDNLQSDLAKRSYKTGESNGN